MYEVHLVRAAGDTLVVTSAADTAAVPLADIDELRLVQASSIGTTDGGRRTRGGLVGADDAVIKLARFEQAERRRIVADLMAERAGTAARP
jgi:chemotaxis protein histidine kinase CheA